LALWDIQWKQFVPEPEADNSTIFIPTDTVDRAFGLLELLTNIEAMMADKRTDGTTLYSAAACPSHESSGSVPDVNFEPQGLQNTGLKDSEIARRLLYKLSKPTTTTLGQPELQDTEYVLDKADIYKVVSNREITSTGLKKPSITDFRKLGKVLQSSGVGRLDEDRDKYYVVVPPEDATPEEADAFDEALRKFANIGCRQLCAALDSKGLKKSGGVRDAAASDAKRSKGDSANIS
jgi:hypothetical protein